MSPVLANQVQHDFGGSVGVDEVEELLMNVGPQDDTQVIWDLDLSSCRNVEPGAGFRLGNGLRRWSAGQLTVRVPEPGQFTDEWFRLFTRSGIGLALSASTARIMCGEREITNDLREYYEQKGGSSGTNYWIQRSIFTGAITPDVDRFAEVFLNSIEKHTQLHPSSLSTVAKRALVNLSHEAVLNVVDHAFREPWQQPARGELERFDYVSVRWYKSLNAGRSSLGGLHGYLDRARRSVQPDRQKILGWVEVVVCDDGCGMAARQSQQTDIYEKPIETEDTRLLEALSAGGSIKLVSRDAPIHGDPGYGFSIIAGALQQLSGYAGLRTGRRLAELDGTQEGAGFEIREESLGWMPGTALHIVFPVPDPQLHL